MSEGKTALRARDMGSRGKQVVVVVDEVSLAGSEEAQGTWGSEKGKS